MAMLNNQMVVLFRSKNTCWESRGLSHLASFDVPRAGGVAPVHQSGGCTGEAMRPLKSPRSPVPSSSAGWRVKIPGPEIDISRWLMTILMTTMWLFNSSPWKDLPVLSSVNHLFLWAIYPMAMLLVITRGYELMLSFWIEVWIIQLFTLNLVTIGWLLI